MTTRRRSAELAGDLLEKLGYEAGLVEDGLQAIARYAEALESGRRFDAVIMDLTIRAGIGGREAITKLLEIDPGARVIVSSGYSADPVKARFRRRRGQTLRYP